MSNNEYLIAYPNNPIILNWVANTIQATGELAGNPSDPKRTGSQFNSSISIKDPCFAKKCYMIIEFDPQKY